MATFIVGSMVFAGLGMVARSLFKKPRDSETGQCGSSCSSCPYSKSCH